MYVVSGSSPLARGLRALLLVLRLATGIIPARAGFTVWGLDSTFTDRDHPRSRGVYRGIAPRSTGRLGSSPLARGLRGRRAGTRRGRRIIPARAGFTRPAM